MAGGFFSESLARRIIRAMRWVERQMRMPGRGRAKKPSVRGNIPLLRYKLTAQLTYRSSANATKTTQDSDGSWHDGTSPDDDIEVWDAILKTGMSLPSGSYVIVQLNPDSGLLNVVNSDECAS